jgi:hypothetical protein
MFIALQFPVADIRRFLPTDTYRLSSPPWPNPQPRVEFVRQFGVVRERELGGVDDWPGEDYYCEAARALRFMGLARLEEFAATLGLRARCSFRRFMHDGRAVARVEVGFAFVPQRHVRMTARMNATDFLALLAATLSVSVRIPVGRDAAVRPLIASGPALAKHYLFASSRVAGGSYPGADPGWMIAAPPVALVQYGSVPRLTALPAGAAPVARLDGHIDLHIFRYARTRNADRLPVWMLGTKDRTSRATLRGLRIHLFRLHAENRCLREVLRAAETGKIRLERGSRASDEFQSYLDKSLRRLNKLEHDGFPQSALLRAARQYDDLVSPGFSRTLAESLDQIRGNLLKTLERYASMSQRERDDRPTYQFNFGAGSPVFHGDFIVAGKIQDSFNRVSESATASDLKQALQDLTKAVAEMLDHLSGDQARRVSTDLEVLTNEAVSPEPRKDWYQLSASGLVAAAKAAGEFATPVVAAVEKVLGLLGP